jgi:hypothetical protein
LASSITGTSVTRGGGGGGGSSDGGSVTPGSGGSGGGGAGGKTSGTAGTVNTGGGGGGTDGGTGGAGGSGIVIIKYPSTAEISGGAGLTFTTSVVDSDKITVFTSGTGTISFR